MEKYIDMLHALKTYIHSHIANSDYIKEDHFDITEFSHLHLKSVLRNLPIILKGNIF